jgi:hypothetical protein
MQRGWHLQMIQKLEEVSYLTQEFWLIISW